MPWVVGGEWGSQEVGWVGGPPPPASFCHHGNLHLAVGALAVGLGFQGCWCGRQQQRQRAGSCCAAFLKSGEKISGATLVGLEQSHCSSGMLRDQSGGLFILEWQVGTATLGLPHLALCPLVPLDPAGGSQLPDCCPQ